jgi:hypothetical protein
MNRLEFFKKNGYYIEKNVYSKKDMDEIFILFYDIFFTLTKKYNVPLSKVYKSSDSVSRDIDLKLLDNLMMECFHFNKDIIGEGYDIVSYSSTFLRFISNEKCNSITKELLELNEASTIYGWTNRVRIDPPADERRTYGWHQEIFYSIPESTYLQTWAPMIRNTTKNNGTIWIAKKSHKEGIAKQKWNDIKGRATQIIVDESVLNKYERVQLEMEAQDVLFFDGKLAHKSGHNITKDEIRFSLVGMWHDISNSKFRGPKPNFAQRTHFDNKKYWEDCNKKFNWGF